MRNTRTTVDDATFDEVRARRLTITADDGSSRIELGTSSDGDAVLRMRDARGTIRAVLSVQDDAPRVRLLDTQGRVRLSGILLDGEPGIELLDNAGRPRMVMYLRGHDHELPDLYFLDERGHPRFGIALDASGHVKMEAQTEHGSMREPMWFCREEATEDEPSG